MTRRVYIVDLIGSQSGMHYYHEALTGLFRDVKDIEFKILSNYTSEHNGRPFFRNIYSGSKASKLFRYTLGFIRFFFLMLFDRNAYFLYLSYGRNQDVPFIRLSALNRQNFIVDIHDFYDVRHQTSANVNRINSAFKNIKKIILHSDQNEVLLERSEFSGNYIKVPHFRYSDKPKAENEPVSKEIKNAVIPDKINLLYFGNIRKSKGVVELYTLLNSITDLRLLENIHIIIAGKDSGNIIAQEDLQLSSSVSSSIILKYISDSELDFLFSNCQYVLLPYLTISQSGVVEMAVTYRKPVLLSDITAFREHLRSYPSFGRIFSLKSEYSFSEMLKSLVSDDYFYFDQKDLDNYYSREIFDKFKEEFLTKFLNWGSI